LHACHHLRDGVQIPLFLQLREDGLGRRQLAPARAALAGEQLALKLAQAVVELSLDLGSSILFSPV
jgi:hypothetical protein